MIRDSSYFKQNQIVSFFQNNLRSFYTDAELKWQYSNDLSLLEMQTDEGKIIGTQGMIPFHLSFAQTQILSHKSESSFLCKDYRGKELFESLYAHAVLTVKEKKNSQIIWGFTALGEYWQNKLGFQYDAQAIKETRLILSSSLIQSTKKKIYYKYKSIYNSFLIPKISLKRWSVRHNLKGVDLTQTQEYFNDSTPHTDLSLDFDSESIQNRVNNSPYIQYENLEIYQDLKLEAVVLFHLKAGVFYISHIWYKNEKNLNQIVKSIILFGKKSKKMNSISFWGNSKNKYLNRIFQVFNVMGAKAILDNDMQLVYHYLNSKSADIPIEKFRITGLWTEGKSY